MLSYSVTMCVYVCVLMLCTSYISLTSYRYLYRYASFIIFVNNGLSFDNLPSYIKQLSEVQSVNSESIDELQLRIL